MKHCAYAFKDGELMFAHSPNDANRLFNAGGLPLLFDDNSDALAERLAPYVSYLGDKPYLTECLDRPFFNIDELVSIRTRILNTERSR
jgi:hypothetical protein